VSSKRSGDRRKTVTSPPHVPVIPKTREHPALAGEVSLALSAELVGPCYAVLIATDHDAVDYALLAEHAKVIVDSRNAMERRGLSTPHLVKA
jgi:UDP-N-acetyl-D-glucosamine dehydrogenase